MALLRRRRDEGAAERQEKKRGLGSAFNRMVATGGIIGIGTGVAAIMGSQDVAAWIVGIVVAGLSVLLAGIVWRTRTL
jgi:hypothetical protein